MNQISKPHIVDLLRIFDKNRMISPRIRYASVRSKPELLKDLAHHFDTSRWGIRSCSLLGNSTIFGGFRQFIMT